MNECIIKTVESWGNSENMIYSLIPCCEHMGDIILNKRFKIHERFSELRDKDGFLIEYCHCCGGKIIFEIGLEHHDNSSSKLILQQNKMKNGVVLFKSCCHRFSELLYNEVYCYSDGALRDKKAGLVINYCSNCGQQVTDKEESDNGGG